MKLNIKTIIIILLILVIILVLLKIIKNKFFCKIKNEVWLMPEEDNTLPFYLCPNPKYAKFLLKNDANLTGKKYVEIEHSIEITQELGNNLVYIEDDPLFKCAQVFLLIR